MRLRRKVLAGLLMASAGASCVVDPPPHVYEAEYSSAAVELLWKHREAGKFETLGLVVEPGRVGKDLAIDGDIVIATYHHGAGDDSCPYVHRVKGTLHLLEHRATDVRARVDAVMQCPEAPPAALKGEFAFETRVPR
jgi:hypothetical protein